MKIVETVEIINARTVIVGGRDVKLTLDTETGQLAINTPAMLTDPTVSLDKLEEKIQKLKEHLEY